MSKKSQMEITNVMFMHLIGFIGIIAFTFLFISLMTGSEARASGLKEESIYQNYARRLISSSDCLAYEYTESYFDQFGSKFYYFSDISPGVIDMGKFFDFNHQNCLKYDLVSGAISNDPKKSEQVFPILIYEVSVNDLDKGAVFSFKSSAFKSKGLAIDIDICRPSQGGYPSVCLLDCEELRNYLNSELYAFYSQDNEPECINFESTEFGTECTEYALPEGYFELSNNEIEALKNEYYYETSLDNVPLSEIPEYPLPGANCWEESFRDSLRAVIPYTNLNCSSVPKSTSYEYGVGNVLETSSQYYVKLKYQLKDNSFVENDGVISIKFCVINIPTMCDPAFKNTYPSSSMQNYLSELGINDAESIYQPEKCEELGLPLI